MPRLTRSVVRDLRNDALSIVFSGGYLAWYADLEKLSVVCKDWKALIRIEEPAFQALPDWDLIIQYIDKVNGANKCRWCAQRVVSNQCGDCGEDVGFILTQADPRCQDGYENLSKYEQARRLIAFHTFCVTNLLSFYGDDFTVRESTTVGFQWMDDFFFSMGSLCKINPKAYWLLMAVVELDIAKGDLACGPYYYKSAFAGHDCDPFTGSSYRDSLAGTVASYIQNVEPLSGNEREIPVADWGSYSPSQIDQLADVLGNILTERDKEADALFGPDLADRMNVFTRVRNNTLSRFDEIFPLKPMPLHDDDFVPPGPFDFMQELE